MPPLRCMQMILQYMHHDAYMHQYTSGELNIVLNEELKLIEELVKVNKLVLNVEKTKDTVCISKYSIKVAPMLHLTIGDIAIKPKTDAKLFRITVDGKMLWNNQIDHMVVKMGSIMADIKH